MIDHLFRVPGEFWNAAAYSRVGALIKDRATGKIVGHLQEVGPWKLSSSLPIPGGNPLQLITETVQIGQLANIQNTLNAVQTLATVGAVASVASLGVSILGFSVVTAKLTRMDRKLDLLIGETSRLRDAVERLNVKVDALPLAKLSAELEAIGLAQGYEHSRQKEVLKRALSELAVLRHYYHALLADRCLFAAGTTGLPAVLDAHERLIACCQGELFAELLIADDPAHVEDRWLRQRDMLHTLRWRDAKELYDLAEEGDRASGVYGVTTAAERQVKVKALTEIRSESLARLESGPHLAAFLAGTGTTPAEYLKAVSEWAGDMPVVAVLTND